MSRDTVKKNIQSHTWQKWIRRPFGVFISGINAEARKRSVMKQVMDVDVEYSGTVHQGGMFWQSPELLEKDSVEVGRLLEDGLSVSSLTDRCQKAFDTHMSSLHTLGNDSIQNMADIWEWSVRQFSFVWITHPIERYYAPRLQEALSQYVKADQIDETVSLLTFPKKQNSNDLLETAIRSDMSIDELVETFSWLKVREAFTDGFTKDDFEAMRRNVEHAPLSQTASKPVGKEFDEYTQHLIHEMQELVFFRTYRTDRFYEFFYTARPHIEAFARVHGLTLTELEDYGYRDLTCGRKVRIDRDTYVMASIGEEYYFYDEPILSDEIESQASEVKGKTAYSGVIRGVAKIVHNVTELDKVHEGDILITQMTFPSFIMAMKRASAFVTDEGGITCHASIVAREMKKPCVIATGNASTIFDDGDMVEVDAEKGVVRKI